MDRWYQHEFLHIYLEWIDAVIGSVYLIAIILLAFQFRNRFLSTSPIRRFFMPGLLIKMLGSIASALVYQYYYGGGDTFNFYHDSSFVHDITIKNFANFFYCMSSQPFDVYPSELAEYEGYFDFIYDSPSWFIVRCLIPLSFLTFDSYIGSGLIFALFSFYASWRFFTLISELYPTLRQSFFYCVFAIPSVVFWGSGIFKDTLTTGGLLLFLYHIYNIFILRKKLGSNLLGALIGFYIVSSIRLFFIVLIVPSFGLLYFVTIRDRIKNNLLRSISLPMLLFVALIVTTFGISRLTSGEGELSRQALTEKSKGFQSWHTELGGSSYSLGDIDYSNTGILKTMPLAINVTLYRPYLTEVHSFFQLISALQSLFFLLFGIRTLLRTRIVGFFNYLLSDSLAIFSLFFSLLHAFVVGFTSFNFGALDRYKIPCLPFYMIALVLINYRFDEANRKAAERRFSIK